MGGDSSAGLVILVNILLLIGLSFFCCIGDVFYSVEDWLWFFCCMGDVR